jgi:hypothetical protein
MRELRSCPQPRPFPLEIAAGAFAFAARSGIATKGVMLAVVRSKQLHGHRMARVSALQHTSNFRQRVAFPLPVVGIGIVLKNSKEDDDHAKIDNSWIDDNSRIDTVGSANGIRRRGPSACKLSVVHHFEQRDRDRMHFFDPRAMRIWRQEPGIRPVHPKSRLRP